MKVFEKTSQFFSSLSAFITFFKLSVGCVLKLGSLKISIIFCVSGTLGLCITSTPGTVKPVGSNLTSNFFFSNWKYSFPKNCSSIVCQLSCHIVELLFVRNF